jgi:hypothetical protein
MCLICHSKAAGSRSEDNIVSFRPAHIDQELPIVVTGVLVLLAANERSENKGHQTAKKSRKESATASIQASRDRPALSQALLGVPRESVLVATAQLLALARGTHAKKSELLR